MTHDVALPSAWVTRWAHLMKPGGTVLDLACGSGRMRDFLPPGAIRPPQSIATRKPSQDWPLFPV